jgi:hypothetical protein
MLSKLILRFADNTAMFVSDIDPAEVCGRLQHQLDTLSAYFKNWKIRVNPMKTQAIYFTRWTSSRIKLDDQEIPWSPEVKYLGLYFDKRITFASHTAKSMKKAEMAFRILYSFLNRKSKLCIQNKLLLYKSCIYVQFCVMVLRRGLIVPRRTKRNFKLFRTCQWLRNKMTSSGMISENEPQDKTLIASFDRQKINFWSDNALSQFKNRFLMN